MDFDNSCQVKISQPVHINIIFMNTGFWLVDSRFIMSKCFFFFNLFIYFIYLFIYLFFIYFFLLLFFFYISNEFRLILTPSWYLHENFTFLPSVVMYMYLTNLFYSRESQTTNTIRLVGCLVFNATFNNIWVISWQSVLLVQETGVYLKTTTDLSQVTDKLYRIMPYASTWSRFELTTSVVIGTDCIGSC